MARVLDIANYALETFDGSQTRVSESMFGAIWINQAREDGFSEASDYLGLQLVRWPGGALCEIGGIDPQTGAVHMVARPGEEDYFSLNPITHPELVHPAAVLTGRESFSDVLRFAVESGSTLSVTLPTQRYIADPAQAYVDVSVLLQRLYEEDEFNGGEVPRGLVFDLGSEHYDPAGYGTVAIQMILALSDFRDSHPDADFKIALQSMQNGGDTSELVEIFQISSFSHLLGEVDVIRHHVLDQNLNQVVHIEDQGPKYWAIKRLKDAVDAAREIGEESELYFSAWTVHSDDAVAENDQGLPAAAAMLSLFSGMVELGADYSAAWGIGAQLSDAERMSYFSAGQNTYSPIGEVYRLMRESLSGASLIAHDGLDHTRSVAPGYHMFAYADDAKVVVFLAAEDFSGPSLTVDLELAGLVGDIGFAWAESVKTSNGTPNGQASVNRAQVEFAGNSMSYTFTQDFEVVRLIIARENPGDGSLQLWGCVNGDVLIGGNSDDFLEGNQGNDSLTGGPGNDMLFGGDGADFLAGGDGANAIDGGLGVDTLDFSQATGRAFADIQFDQRGAGFLRFYDIGQPRGDTYANLENIIGGDFADNLRGDGGANHMQGGGVSDRLYGRAGDDILEGGTGADALYGNLGADTMSGGADAGRRDRFIYFEIEESGVGAGNRDLITDLVPGEDRIEISRFDADTTQGGNQAFTFVGAAGLSGNAGEIGYVQIGGNTIVQADVDGDGTADFEIELTGLLTLTAGDFLL